jgi:hypothetical protein
MKQNGGIYYIYGSSWLGQRFGIRGGLEWKQFSYDCFGTMYWQSMLGELKSISSLTTSAHFVVEEWKKFTTFGNVPNFKELDIGPLTSLIGFALGQVKKVHGKCSLSRNLSSRTTSKGILRNSTLSSICFK